MTLTLRSVFVVLALFASPLSAQTLRWKWDATAIPYIQNPQELQMEIWADAGDWRPITGFTCGPVIPDVGFALDCSWPIDAQLRQTLAAPGPHSILLRATRDGVIGWPSAVVAPYQVTGDTPSPELKPCSYIVPGGTVLETRPVGHSMDAFIPAARNGDPLYGPKRLFQLRAWGYQVDVISSTTISVRVWAYCPGVD